MAIISKDTTRKQVIDLTGPQGNAYYLLGLAMKLCKQIGLDVTAVLDDLKGGDYEHLITRFDYHFGFIIDLER
jgi:hypothetical protein|tara:strand:+ start:982 stop:1200 length:219 start_codon:yes stop_codon:yes gene_type:complete